jgi:hypothetical protein
MLCGETLTQTHAYPMSSPAEIAMINRARRGCTFTSQRA